MARSPRVDLATGAVLVLAESTRLGPAAIRALIDAFAGPLEALEALATRAPVPIKLTRPQREAVRKQLAGRDARRLAADAAATAGRSLEPGDRLLGYGLSGYPKRLERLHFPPPVLWARGPLSADAPRAVSVVGTRRSTAPARQLAYELAAELAAAGVRVVSGLASGIDGQAHRGALAAGGETAAVLGSGLRFRYPVQNHDLYARLRGDGLILTEFPPHARPEPHNFPRRNRIVAALGHAVVVVQAGQRSGALLTAGEALDIGVDVLVCPGDPRHAANAGCHELLRDGAGLVTCAADVLSELGWRTPCAPAADGELPGAERPPNERALIERLEREPAVLDELAELAGGIGAVTTMLTRLELSGAVRGLPGGRYELAGGSTE